MRDRDFYPMGAYDDPSAPYNEVTPPEKEFDICISQTLSKSTTVCTSKYNPEFDEESGRMYADTDDTDWEEACDDAGVHTPLELIELFGEFLKDHLKTIPKDNANRFKRKRYERLVQECEGWVDDDLEIVEE